MAGNGEGVGFDPELLQQLPPSCSELNGGSTPSQSKQLTCPNEVASLVHLALEELQPNYGIDDDHEEHKQGNVEQGEHGLEDGVEDYLKACHKQQGEGKKKKESLLLPVSCPCLYKQRDAQVRRGKGGLGKRDTVTHWAPLTPAVAV